MNRQSGLKDRNGREIYEGDSISFVLRRSQDTVKGTVAYGLYDDAEQCEVWTHLGWYVQWINEMGHECQMTLPDVAANSESSEAVNETT